MEQKTLTEKLHRIPFHPKTVNEDTNNDVILFTSLSRPFFSFLNMMSGPDSKVDVNAMYQVKSNKTVHQLHGNNHLESGLLHVVQAVMMCIHAHVI